MKKLLSVVLVMAMLGSLFVMNASAALPTFQAGEETPVFFEDVEEIPLSYDLVKSELSTILGAYSEISGSQRKINDSGEEDYGKVINIAGYYNEAADGTVLARAASFMGFGKVGSYAKYKVEVDVKPIYASGGIAFVIPWGDNSQSPATLMLSPDLFTDIDLQKHSTDATWAVLPEESLATNKWYTVTLEVNNKNLSGMTRFDAATVANNVNVEVKDLTTGVTVIPQKITVQASPHTDSVCIRQAAAKIMTLCANAHVGMGLYYCSGLMNCVVGADGGNYEQSKASYYFDNIALSQTPADKPYETTGVLYENYEGQTLSLTSAVGSALNFPGGAISTDPETNIGQGHDKQKMIVTFDAVTDGDMFQFELYGMNVKNSDKWNCHVNSEDGGQITMAKIPVEEAARGKKYSYKVIGQTGTVYRAEAGTNNYAKLEGVELSGTLSNMSSSCGRFLFSTTYGTTTGSYLVYDNMVVVNVGAMAITYEDDMLVKVAFEGSYNPTAVVFAAFYDVDGNVMEIRHSDLTTLKTGDGEVTFLKPASEYSAVKFFIWDSFDGLRPIAENPWTVE